VFVDVVADGNDPILDIAESAATTHLLDEVAGQTRKQIEPRTAAWSKAPASFECSDPRRDKPSRFC
jgi:hypothetical protein